MSRAEPQLGVLGAAVSADAAGASLVDLTCQEGWQRGCEVPDGVSRRRGCRARRPETREDWGSGWPRKSVRRPVALGVAEDGTASEAGSLHR